MHLIQSSPTTVTEFCSLSLVLKPTPTADLASAMGEPLMLASPLASISSSSSLSALKELHAYIATTLKAASSLGKVSPHDRYAVDWLREDDRILEDMQIFRPNAASGLALHYRLIRDLNQLSILSQHILFASRGGSKGASASPSPAPPPSNSPAVSGLVSILFVVGMSGLPCAHSASSLQYSMSQRINDCITFLVKTPTKDTPVVKTILATFLINEDEHRKTNEMTLTPNLFSFPGTEDAEGGRGGLSSAMGIMPAGLRPSRRGSVMGGSRTAVANLKEETAGVGESSEFTPNQASNGVELTLLNGNDAELARHLTEQLNVLSVAESDTFLRKFAQTGQERKANLDLTGGGKSRFRRRKSENDADFDNFEYKGPAKIAKKKTFNPCPDNTKDMQSALQLRQPKKDTRAKAAPVPALSASRSDATAQRFSNQDPVVPNGFDPFTANRQQARRRSQGPVFDDESSLLSDNRSSAQDSTSSQARVQVNIALNEDLACSYKNSQMSSCSVEGVVQVQVKSSGTSSSPFFLLLRDPAGHVDSLQENKKFADDVSGLLTRNGEESVADRKFAVSIPKGENYFPALRYKCISDLRPVPIRVQTRVKVEGGFCRVALQISSNPNNEASLTDLTIIMGVPDEVDGESLVTQPAGGVWNESKRSVIWCVSELGGGEKFQLQARFGLLSELLINPENDKPMFPVLVRCQCLFAQLSGVELEVRDIPDVFPADISMKLARRFRLVHRERS